MGEGTKIEWADHTFNPWVGCTKVSPACDHCYAEGWAKRSGLVKWGHGEPRRRTSDDNWRKPLKWNRDAAAKGIRYRVFCASLADVFDTEVPEQWRDDLFALIACTPNLDWLLLTKRPQVARRYADGTQRSGEHWLAGIDGAPAAQWPLPNVWLGTTVENQAMADLRIPILLDTPAAVRFLSCEPLLGPVDLCNLAMPGTARTLDAFTGLDGKGVAHVDDGLDWIISGGESGPGARPSHPDWHRALRDRCAAAGVPFFMKQMTKKAPIPDDLLVREHPHA